MRAMLKVKSRKPVASLRKRTHKCTPNRKVMEATNFHNNAASGMFLTTVGIGLGYAWAYNQFVN